MSDGPRPATPVIVTADDLTGACDVGTCIFRAGIAVSVIPANPSGDFTLLARSPSRTVVLDLNCRENAPATIRRKLARASSPFDPTRLRWYHKIDSTLRGAPGAQIAALVNTARAPLAALVPANPDNGRVTRNGIHHIHNRPLARSFLRDDPVSPVRRSRITEILGRLPGIHTRNVALNIVRKGPQHLRALLSDIRRHPSLIIFDAETNRDLRSIACALRDVRLVIASASLARYLARPWALKPARRRPATDLREITLMPKTLIVAGSPAPATLRQNETTKPRLPRNVILLAPPGDGATSPRRARATIQRMLKTNLDRAGRFIISGGRTAEDVCRILRVRSIRLLKPLGPGISLALAHGPKKYLMVLKPGGFGKPDFYLKALRAIEKALPSLT